MNDTEALDTLRAQGFATGTPDPHTGHVRVWISDSEEGVDVQVGRELRELAEGTLTFEDILLRRDDEVVARTE